jgi:hypothetical protein
MTSTYEKIATQTLTSATGIVTFSSIPQTYTDLRLIIKGGIADGGFFIGLRAGNGNVATGTIYSDTLVKEETGALSSRYSNKTLGQFYDQGGNNDISYIAIADFMNYSNTTTYKTYLSRNGSASSGFSGVVVGLIASTAAINIIEISECGMGGSGFFNYGNMLSGSTFTLYGIKAE